MKILSVVLSALLAFGCSGCATNPHVQMPSQGPGLSTWAWLDSYYAEKGGGSVGSSCVVGIMGNGKVALTAKHVVTEDIPPTTQKWASIGRGAGTFRIAWKDEKLDLAEVLLFGENTLGVAPLRMTPPEIAEEITIDAVIADVPTIVHGRVLGIDKDGDLLLDAIVWPGTSGGCVKDLHGNVLALALGTVYKKDFGPRSAGRAVPLWDYKGHHVFSVPVPAEEPTK